MRHEDLWNGIERLAESKGVSVSRMARIAGLDPTTFNRSKRVAAGGRKRWPTTESLSKVLEATGASLQEFVHLVHPERSGTMIPAFTMADIRESSALDGDGFPRNSLNGDGRRVWFPELNDARVFAITIEGDACEPVYRDRDMIVVAPNARVRGGDRAVFRLRDGELRFGSLVRRTLHWLEVRSLDGTSVDSFEVQEVDWISRVVWAKQ